MHAFHCFMHYMHAFPVFQRKTLHELCFITKFSKINWGGGPNALLAPQSVLGGSHGPPCPPPVADPMMLHDKDILDPNIVTKLKVSGIYLKN